MAILQDIKTKQRIYLRVNHTFGRDPEANITELENPDASRIHASIVWDGEVWIIKDSSTNGTFLNKKRIRTGNHHPLKVGIKIQFGILASHIWEVIDINAPRPCLIPVDPHLPLIELHDIVVLPIDHREILIYLSEQGQWVCEQNNECSILCCGDKVGIQNKRWQFVETKPCAKTEVSEHLPLTKISFNFTVSQNEEHVNLILVINNENYDLGERSHHYLLLILARQRLRDQQKELNEREQGWIKKELLIRMMGMQEQHINIQIYRFRKQFSSILPGSFTLNQIIERRPGELRFVYSDISIQGGFEPIPRPDLLHSLSTYSGI